jgi:lysophospholipase L1-like esterase
MQKLMLTILFATAMMLIGCDQLFNEPASEKQQDDDIEIITLLADTLYAKNGEVYEFHLTDYFESDAPFVFAEFYGDHLEITALPNDSFRVSQLNDSAGHYLLNAEVTNEDDYTLESELIYAVNEPETNTDEPAQIFKIRNNIDGKQGTSTEINIENYFESEAQITSVEMFSDAITIEPVGNNHFVLSQSEDLSGDHIIDVVVMNSDDQTLETELNYRIEPITYNPPPSDETLVIMPLGDSMTNDSRPRVKFWNLLEGDGHELDYVGNQQQSSSIPDPDHEGVGGIKIEGIMDKAESLMQTHKPKYVALMVGTNDIAWYFDETGQEIADRWNDLIDLIFSASEQGTYILAATIPPVSSSNVGKSTMEIRDRAVLVQHYNAALRDHIENRRSQGDKIILADMEAAMDPGQHLSGDGVHLNSEGYSIMGTVYYEAMNKALSEQ